MTDESESLQGARFTRVIITLLVLMAFLGGSGVVAADREENRGKECPDDNPTQAYDNVPMTAVQKSFDGRMRALEATLCPPPESQTEGS